MNFTKF